MLGVKEIKRKKKIKPSEWLIRNKGFRDLIILLFYSRKGKESLKKFLLNRSEGLFQINDLSLSVSHTRMQTTSYFTHKIIYVIQVLEYKIPRSIRWYSDVTFSYFVIFAPYFWRGKRIIIGKISFILPSFLISSLCGGCHLTEKHLHLSCPI